MQKSTLLLYVSNEKSEISFNFIKGRIKTQKTWDKFTKTWTRPVQNCQLKHYKTLPRKLKMSQIK